jgi:regulatory protein
LLISAINPQSKDPLRENVFLNGKFGFGISAEARFDARLKVGQDIAEKRIRELILNDQTHKLIFSAEKFLAFRPRSEKEIRDSLKRKIEKSDYLEPELLLTNVVTRLKKLGLLDDQEFSRWWVEQRQKFKPKGERILRSELHQKGIPREIIDQLFFKYETPSNELMRIAQKKFSTYQKLPDQQFKQKMTAYLARRGYDWDEIRSVVDTLSQDR